jgi:hypothetical protein
VTRFLLIAEQLIADVGSDDAHVAGVIVVDLVQHATVSQDVLVDLEGIGPGADDVGPFGIAACLGDAQVAGPHFGRGLVDERGAGPKGIQIVNGEANRLIGQMLLGGWDILLFDADFFQSTNGDEGFAHPVFHAFDQRAHRHEAGDAEDDPEHGQEGAEFMRPDFL